MKEVAKNPRMRLMAWSGGKLIVDEWVKAYNGPAPKNGKSKAKRSGKAKKRSKAA